MTANQPYVPAGPKNFSVYRYSVVIFTFSKAGSFNTLAGERGGSVVECRTPEREVGDSKPTAAVLCPWARHFTPRKYWLITQEAVAPSRHDWKIVDWDVKPQHKQTSKQYFGYGYTHDRRNPYQHDRRADKDSYPHDRNVTDDLCSLIKLCFAFIMVNFST